MRSLTSYHCEECGKEFKRKARSDRKIRFCSLRCVGLSNGKVRRKRIDTTCPHCHAPITAAIWKLRKRKVYCSKKCSSDAMRRPKVKKKCYGCGIEIEVFSYNLKEKNYCSRRCKPLNTDKNPNAISKTPEYRRAAGKRSYWRNPDLTRLKKVARRHKDYAAHLEKERIARQKKPHLVLERTRRYRKKNPDKVVLWTEARRCAVSANAISLGDWTALKKKYNFSCLCCHKQEPEIKLELDHIVPVTRGGKHEIQNIQPLCKICNKKKGNRRFTDYRVLWGTRVCS